jgi:phospholipid/cholesterol/gamma-HCH transport system substrate-binding protein
MNANDVTKVIRFKVGSFTILGLLLIGVMTVFVNDRPYWWRGCNPIFITVEDATGLKTKSPVKSLGLQVGYLRSVQLVESKVKLGICVTAPIEITPETRAYIRGEGFLGDKVVELKPVKYIGTLAANSSNSVLPSAVITTSEDTNSPALQVDESSSSASSPDRGPTEEKGIPLENVPAKTEDSPKTIQGKSGAHFSFFMSSAFAEEPAKEVPVGVRAGDMDKLMEKADSLMVELTNLSKNLKEGLDPKDIKATLQQLNKTLENASKMLSPDGGLNTTARRALLKLEDAFEQIRQQATKINQGQGSVGKLLNDPIYADELLKAMKAINTFLNKASEIRLVVGMGTEQIPVYKGSRGFFQLQVYPTKTRYYLVGVSIDPRGRLMITNTTTTAGGQTNIVRSEEVQEGGILITAMLGKIFFDRYDFSIGALHGDGAASFQLHAGPKGAEQFASFRFDVYARARGVALNNRIYLQVRPLIHSDVFKSVYFRGGLDSTRRVDGRQAWLYGAGVTFDDDDIKMLFSLAR